MVTKRVTIAYYELATTYHVDSFVGFSEHCFLLNP